MEYLTPPAPAKSTGRNVQLILPVNFVLPGSCNQDEAERGHFFTFKIEKHDMTQQEMRDAETLKIISATLLWDKIKGAEQIIANCENLTPEVISAIVELSIDASVSDNKYEGASAVALLRTALGKAAERIVVLETMLESERKLRQEDRDFATKNATHL